jgi:hypothetical protein
MGIKGVRRVKGVKGVVGALGALVVATAAVAVPRAAGGVTEASGLWPTSFAAGQTAADCGRWRLDENDFCVADDARNGLEIGTKFRSAKAVWVTGVRIYRADPGTLKGSLWRGDGTLLARGTFADRPRNGWQDLTFADPVRIEPEVTHVASYFTPATKYAFAYRYFSERGRTVGPVTALRSVEGDPNGVHCYDDAVCGTFPVRGYRGSTYWVTPLWVSDGVTPPPDEPPPDEPPTDPPGTDTGAPRVTATAPADGAVRVAPGATVRARFSEPVRRASLRRATVRLVHEGTATSVPASLWYDADRARVVLDPRDPLRRGASYRVHVATGVRDLVGNRLDQDRTRSGSQSATWRFRTRR